MKATAAIISRDKCKPLVLFLLITFLGGWGRCPIFLSSICVRSFVHELRSRKWPFGNTSEQGKESGIL